MRWGWPSDWELTGPEATGGVLSYEGSPERLAAFRAGETVSLQAWDVPESARGGEPKECLVWRRAVVWPDGSVQIRDATGAEMLGELGL